MQGRYWSALKRRLARIVVLALVGAAIVVAAEPANADPACQTTPSPLRLVRVGASSRLMPVALLGRAMILVRPAGAPKRTAAIRSKLLSDNTTTNSVIHSWRRLPERIRHNRLNIILSWKIPTPLERRREFHMQVYRGKMLALSHPHSRMRSTSDTPRGLTRLASNARSSCTVCTFSASSALRMWT